MNMSIMSIIGLVALAGIVANDSLVMVDFINRYRVMATQHLKWLCRLGQGGLDPLC